MEARGKLKYKRILVKISGEALAGKKHFGLDYDVIGKVCDALKTCVDMGVQVGVVVGGGNFWRGVKDGNGMERSRADHIGMLATAMNSLALADALEKRGVSVRVQTAIEMRAIAEPYIRPGRCATWKREGSLSSGAAPETPIFQPIPPPFCGAPRSARTL